MSVFRKYCQTTCFLGFFFCFVYFFLGGGGEERIQITQLGVISGPPAKYH